MNSRTPFVGGNWKMNTDLASARTLAGDIIVHGRDLFDNCEVVLFPPLPYITQVGDVVRGTPVRLGSQDVFHEPNGAYTGEVSAEMLRDIDVTYVIVGHSERRHTPGLKEPNWLINAKAMAAINAGLTVVHCVGEVLEEREAGDAEQVVLDQLHAGFDGVSNDHMDRVVIAYEPVWAIGTGRTATPDDAQHMHKIIRRAVAEAYDEGVAGSIRIIYGGSVKAANAAGLFGQADIDGGLIGGASLDGDEFIAIVKQALGARC
jgi:triosephosphate isomerase (TIM)